MTSSMQIPSVARVLGLAGLLPQLLFVLLVASGSNRYAFAAQALAFAYAALILSFLGGLWWGLAARAESPPNWLWVAAVMPSLIAFAAFLPWAFAGAWPCPSLIVLGLCLVGSLGVDRALVRQALAPAWWMRLRVPLSLGLGALTLSIPILA